MKDIFHIQRKCLQLMGHNTQSAVEIWRKSHILIYILTLLLVLSAQMPMLNYAIYHIDDLPSLTACLSICCTNLLTFTKISTFILHKRKFMTIMETLTCIHYAGMSAEYSTEHDNLKCFLFFFPSQDKDPSAQQILNKTNKTVTMVTQLYHYLVHATALYFMLGPLTKIFYGYTRGKKILLELPMPMRFPFEYEALPGYGFAYIYTGLVTLVVIVYASAIDGLFVSFTMNLRAHFQVLQYYIISKKYTRLNQADQHAIISSNIRYHIELLELSQQVRAVYNPIVFAEFLMTSLQVCVIIYQLMTHMDTLMTLVINSTFLSAVLLQLFFYCYGGETLKEESLNVGISIQLTNWYLLTPQHMHMLRLMMLRSQRAAIIKAGFYEATLANFMAILKAAMSYMTLIQSIEN